MSNSNANKGISDLRAVLFATLEGIKDGSIDIDKARAVNDVAKTIVDTGKLEVDYLRVSGGGESEFLDVAVGNDNLPPGVTRHRLQG